MAGVNALSVVARMTNEKALRVFASALGPRYAMVKLASFEDAVPAAISLARPDPTSIWTAALVGVLL
jgi:hypothetical protein